MKIFTSNYFKYKGSRGVQISNTKPNGVSVSRVIRELFPNSDLVWRWNKLKKLPSGDPEREFFWSEDFVPDYWSKLNKLGKDAVLSLLRDGDVLLCWCSGEECHRHILANWLRVQGVEVEELV